MNTVISDLGQGLVHLFYPRLCEGCSKPLVHDERILCISCAVELPLTGYHGVENNETALRFSGRVPFIHATSIAYFTDDGLLQHLLHGLKYGGKKEIGTWLGDIAGRELASTPWAGSIDAIVPVPLYSAKEAKRGYNQSELIAGGMAGILGRPVNTTALERVRDTESQTKKSRTERVDNMAGAFRLKDAGALAGKHVLLCDDVLTTGATLEACALALLQGTGIKISIATIGIAVS